MAQTTELKATVRERVGKGAARNMRRQGLVPAVIYGNKQEPDPINLVYPDVWKHYQTGRFLTTLFTIDVDGKKTQVIPRDVQVDPVRDFLTHVDFQRVVKGSQIRVAIPVRFHNQDKSPGIKRGGVLNVVRHEVDLYCPAEAIPDHIVVDLEGLEIGASVHISHVKLPAGTSPVIKSRDFTVATIAGAIAEKVEAEVTADVVEGAAEGGEAEGAGAAPDAKAAAGGKAPAAAAGKAPAGGGDKSPKAAAPAKGGDKKKG